MQEHLIEIRITPQAKLIMSNLNDSTCNLNYIELQRNLAIGERKAQKLILLYFPSLLTNTTYMAVYSLKMKLLKAF